MEKNKKGEERILIYVNTFRLVFGNKNQIRFENVKEAEEENYVIKKAVV